MLRQLSVFFVLLLCLSSCQQRYGHVKRVKGDKNKSVQKGKPSPEKETETLVIILVDTLKEALVLPEIPENEPKEKAVEPETRSRTNPEKSTPEEELRQLRPFKDLFVNPNEDDPNDKPLSFREKVLIISISYVWFNLFLYIALIPYSLAYYIILFTTLGISLVTSPLVIPVLFALAAMFFVLAIIFSFIVGKKRINKKLGRDLKWGDLIGYFLIAFLATIIIHVASSYLAFFVIEVLRVLPYLLLLFAILYILWWD